MQPLYADPLAALNERISAPALQLGEPGPTAEQLDRLLSAAVRVPDHGKLTPWRLLLVRDDARLKLGEALAKLHAEVDPDVAPAKLEKDRARLAASPLMIVVIAVVDGHHKKVPAQEQILSAGCVAYSLLIGAQSLGLSGQWLTGWAAYEPKAGALFGLKDDERIVGFMHIGTPRERPPERTRPLLADVVGEWKP
ncbi:MAG TPA: nitroreductase [Rudaea sp.]|nr:nitroreductase [Rudaea sp.]